MYLKRSAKEAGLKDHKNLQDLTKPTALYPSLTWHSNGNIWDPNDDEEDLAETTTKRSSSVVYCIQKGRDVRSRMQAMYQVHASCQEQDVARYRLGNEKNESVSNISSISAAAQRLGPAYVPQELLQTAARKQTPMSQEKSGAFSKHDKNMPANLNDLEEMERKRRIDAGEGEEEDTELDQSQDLQSDIEEEEAADYTMNYYESEGEESDAAGGDGGEPTF